VRRALEEMGPTFIKLGQVLATRVDLFDAEWIAEFSRLQDSAPTVPWEEIRAQLSADFGVPPETVFSFIDPQPLAAGSIAQVHRARLDDDGEVVVKVRRPGIRPLIEADLRWLMRLAEFAESEYPALRPFHPREVVRQLTHSLRRELDFASECRSAERIAENFADFALLDDLDDETAQKVGADGTAAASGHRANSQPDGAAAAPLPAIVIPRVYWPWTGERVCVQEYIDGIAGRDLAAVDRAGLDRRRLARRGAQAVLKMIVEDGFFHADPHPGNIFYLPGDRIAFIDFGMVGRLTDARREQVVQLLFGLVRHQPARVADVLLDWTDGGARDEEGLLRDIQVFVDQYHGVPLKQLRLGNMLSELTALLREHRLALPPDLALLIKAFISLEGMGRELDPDFDMAGEALPMLRRVLRARYSPRALAQRGRHAVGELLALLSSLPRDLSRLLRAARRGRLEIHIDVARLTQVGSQLDRAISRLVVGIVVAALIVGSSIVMTVPGGPSLLGLPLFGLLGFLGAVIGGLWLLLSIHRSGRVGPE
jgi:ubiquinone biosynthesis protein